MHFYPASNQNKYIPVFVPFTKSLRDTPGTTYIYLLRIYFGKCTTSQLHTSATITGQCATDVTIQFTTADGEHATFTGNVKCTTSVIYSFDIYLGQQYYR
jgi:hypothetical protein